MKKIFLLTLLLFSINFYSQSKFTKGYFVDNTGKKNECLINTSDWDLYPKVINYKLEENSDVLYGDTNTIKEFGAEGEYSFKRFNVDTDEYKTGSISNDKSITYTTKTLFLKEISTGKANLYSYGNSGSMKYFFSTNKGETPIQLEYKRFSNGSEIFQNNNFRQQLFNKLKSDNLKQNDFDKLEYKSESLLNLFERYNGNDTSKTKEIFKKMIDFNLYLKGGYQQNSFSADSHNDFTGEFDFDDVSLVKIGVELEFVFASKSNNNFAAYIEFSNASFNGDLTKSYGKVHFEYSTIEVPLGIKYYIGISKSSKIFISTALQIGFSYKSDFTLQNFQDIYGDLKDSPIINFGIGYKFKNKLMLGFNTTTGRNVVNSPGWSSDYKSTYVMLGYNFL